MPTIPTATVRRRHLWREQLVDAFRCADEAWRLQAEAEAIGYATELREFAEQHPRPTLKGFMLALAREGEHLAGVELDGQEAA